VEVIGHVRFWVSFVVDASPSNRCFAG